MILNTNKPKTYEIQIKSTGKVIDNCRVYNTAIVLLQKLQKEYFEELKIVKVKKNKTIERMISKKQNRNLT